MILDLCMILEHCMTLYDRIVHLYIILDSYMTLQIVV